MTGRHSGAGQFASPAERVICWCGLDRCNGQHALAGRHLPWVDHIKYKRRNQPCQPQATERRPRCRIVSHGVVWFPVPCQSQSGSPALGSVLRGMSGTSFTKLAFAEQKSIHTRSVRMKTVLAASAIAILSFTTPSLSQTPETAQPNAAGAAQGNLPESMRIQQQVTKKDLADPKALVTKGGAATTDAPGAARSPIEHNRLDPEAPSRQRLQVDEGASGRAVQNPGANGATPAAAGNSFNTVIEGSPSNNGTSTGVSGTAPSSTSRVLTSPSGSVTPSASPSGASGASGSGTSGSASGTSSNSGSAGGGASGGGGSH